MGNFKKWIFDFVNSVVMNKWINISVSEDFCFIGIIVSECMY